MERLTCANCKRSIDAAARLCVYCGADPATGARFDPSPILEDHFTRKEDLPAHESLLEFFRQRQAIVLIAVVGLLALLGLGFHEMIARRNATEVSDVPAVPLTEIADLNEADEQPELPLPDVGFPHDGSPRSLRTFLVEPGAVTPVPPATATE